MDNPNQNRNQKRNGNGNGNKPGRNNQLILLLVVAAVVTLLCVSMMSSFLSDGTRTEVPYSDFIQMVKDHKVKEVTIKDDEIVITPVSEYTIGNSGDTPFYYLQTESYYTVPAYDPELIQLLLDNDVEINVKKPDTNSTLLDFLLVYILPVVLVWVFIMFIMKRAGGGGVMGVGKSNAKMYDIQKETGVSFKDVAGEDEAKESLQEIVDFLHNPGRYSTIGAKLPKGALLVGPPGTGKTLLAKAVAGEAKVPFFSLSGSDFVEMFVGVGASRVRDLFKKAQENAPCIVFIDEIDAIGKSRDSRYGGGNDEREQTLNQLLSEMDGFDSNKGVFILAATNRPEILDKALLRPGRLDRRIIVDKPDLKGRVNILKVHSKDVLMDDSVDLEAIALATSGAVGSDLANMINEAAINAVKHGRKVVSQSDLFEAVEVVLVGKEKKDRIMSEKERRIVSYHEVGHALVSALQKDSEPVQKITIVPRTMGALGYVMNVPEEEKYLNSEAELRAMLVQFLGGRAAEEIVFDTVTTGAANDIERATSVARAMVTQYGMSKKFGLMGLESIESKYLDGRAVLNCSDVTAADIDNEVKLMLEEAHSEAIRLLSENREALDKIAAFLIERETITGEEFMKIFREIRDGEGEKPAAEAGQEEAGQEEAGQAEVREATAEQAPAEEPPVGSIKE
ncbi:ATP-dependent zinc metalloprotease FtsH [Fusibacillus kribbianus]|uniref:ATP-dependent zinc metalloprotease FtsH n=1 Tax=Fusibacillus kribbianus TaxID=3044208 RepID=A0AAP4BBM0_9FIRM|nr:ATP-dependent zinc metalloprotease FtsH [Ruminococcus sp. YH-rum2234]MDI9242655.1 ATP-dependent zinc metalloprotease FtsH [Ruminococcus sp. YH-rum2234]